MDSEIIVLLQAAGGALIAGPILQLLGIDLARPVNGRSDVRPGLVAGVVTVALCMGIILLVVKFIPSPWRMMVWPFCLIPIVSFGATIPKLLSAAFRGPKQ